METRHTMQKLVLTPAEILITGGSGFLGRHLLSKLIDEGYTVRMMTRQTIEGQKNAPLNHRNLQIVQGNVNNFADVLYAAKGVKTVLHLAAAMSGDWSDHQQTTVNGTRNILQICRQLNIRRLIYVSTLNVYDSNSFQEDLLIDESFQHEQNPHWRGYYSAAKLSAELKVIDYADKHPDLQTFIFRPGLIYGPGLDPLLNDLGIKTGNRFIVCPGNGKRKLPLIHVFDVVNALNIAVTSKLKGKHIYNLVNKTCPTQQEYLQLYNQITGSHFMLVPIPGAVCKTVFMLLDFIFGKLLRKPKNLVYRLKSITVTPRFSIARAQRQLNWEPHIQLPAGISSCLEQMADHNV